uniref:Uncharacterized protein n=1 Tax=Panagrolaimus sp. ES5 TaxID=591445 RepID=A0AC34FVT2_9BILA
MDAHEPTPERGRYEAYMGTTPISGSQLFGCPTPNATVRKMEFHPLHVFVVDTDNIKMMPPKLLSLQRCLLMMESLMPFGPRFSPFSSWKSKTIIFDFRDCTSSPISEVNGNVI